MNQFCHLDLKRFSFLNTTGLNVFWLSTFVLVCHRKLCKASYFDCSEIFQHLKKFFFNLFLERGGGKKKERERNINMWLPLTCPLWGTWPATQACALTGNWTDDLLVHRLTLNPLSHTRQGSTFLYITGVFSFTPQFIFCLFFRSSGQSCSLSAARICFSFHFLFSASPCIYKKCVYILLTGPWTLFCNLPKRIALIAYFYSMRYCV